MNQAVSQIVFPWQSALPARRAPQRVWRPAEGDRIKRVDSIVERQDSREAIARRMEDCIAAIAASQDRAAFESLFRHFAPRLQAYLRKLGANPAAAEELMQEAMVLVWRKAAQFDRSKSSASTWIFTIVRNLRIDAFRRESRPEVDMSDPALMPDPDPDADMAIVSRQSADRLHEALAALNDNERAILRLAYFDDKSQSDIAAELRIPLGTVKSRVRLAFAKLRASLADPAGDRP